MPEYIGEHPLALECVWEMDYYPTPLISQNFIRFWIALESSIYLLRQNIFAVRNEIFLAEIFSAENFSVGNFSAKTFPTEIFNLSSGVCWGAAPPAR